MKSIIFHHPLPLFDNPKSGSQIRPIRMLEAFKNLGYEVDLVVGYSAERKKAIEAIKQKIALGKKYDFMYCENSTMPTQLTDPHHLPLNPCLDFEFFRFLKKSSIPIGLFYRDIYWAFEIYNEKVPLIKRSIAKLFYRYELKFYNKILSKMYLPSIKMKEYLPYLNENIIDSLPPGYSEIETFKSNSKLDTGCIKLIYVGGLSEHYKLDLLVKNIGDFPNFQLIICTREAEWLQEKYKYEPIPKNLKIIHKSGKELDSFYNESDIAILYVEPQEYWEFAVPIKLFEYIGKRKPILASQGTLAAKFIDENNIGWVLPYEDNALQIFLSSITLKNIADFDGKINECATNNSWQARASKVIRDLTKVN